jgi:hypothetical protein
VTGTYWVWELPGNGEAANGGNPGKATVAYSVLATATYFALVFAWGPHEHLAHERSGYRLWSFDGHYALLPFARPSSSGPHHHVNAGDHVSTHPCAPWLNDVLLFVLVVAVAASNHGYFAWHL